MSESRPTAPLKFKIEKRDRSLQDFSREKVVKLISALLFDLSTQHINVEEVALKVEAGLKPNMKSTELVNLIAETLAYRAIVHPDYSVLAARVAMTALHKVTKDKLIDYANQLYHYKDENGRDCKLLSDETYKVFLDYQDALQAIIDYKKDFTYDFFGLKTLEKSYLFRVKGAIAERPQQMLMRVCVGIHGSDIPSIVETYNLMSNKFFTHATPTLFSAGTPTPQMSSCFLLSMAADSIDGIYTTLKNCALISKCAGGIGLSVSCIRAKGSYIRGTNGISNGLVPMLRVFDSTARYVDQGGGKRKGSFAIYLEPWHADIYDFLNLKKNHGKEEMRARDLFFGLWIPDLFMKRVEEDDNWTLMCPSECPGLENTWGEEFEALYIKYEKEKKGRTSIKARDLFNEIIKAQIETGTPYMLYKDACNRKSNQQNLGTIRCSNLCTEIVEYSSPDEVAVCNLASIALNKFVNKKDNSYDFENLIKVTAQVVRNLNKIIDKNYYPIPETKNSNMRHRPIGIGVQGFADALAMLRYDYDSPEALELSNKIFETIYYAACLESMKLAKEQGHYETFAGSPASKGILQFDMWHTKPTMYPWDELKEQIKKFGMRNSLLVAPMPTASTSQILGNNETFEAFTSNLYSRKVLSGEFICVNRHLIEELIKLDLWNEKIRQKILVSNGSIQSIAEIPADVRSLFRTVWEIKQKAIINLAIGRGPFIDQSQSLNIHLSEPDTSKISSMHFHGWKNGLKTGMYYLRTKPAADAIKFTVDQQILLEAKMSQKEQKEEILKKREEPAEKVFSCPLKKKTKKNGEQNQEDDEECLACGS